MAESRSNGSNLNESLLKRACAKVHTPYRSPADHIQKPTQLFETRARDNGLFWLGRRCSRVRVTREVRHDAPDSYDSFAAQIADKLYVSSVPATEKTRLGNRGHFVAQPDEVLRYSGYARSRHHMNADGWLT